MCFSNCTTPAPCARTRSPEFQERTADQGPKAGVDALIKTLFDLVDTPTAINGHPLSAYAGRYYNDYVGNFDLT